MSGHSKWHSIKHKKGAADAKRGKLFAVLIRQIEIAARSGGGDQASNATLRSMVQKARDNSLPVDTIQRAIKRGTGEEEGVIYEQVSYEGYAASGVAVIVQAGQVATHLQRDHGQRQRKTDPEPARHVGKFGTWAGVS